MAVKRNQLVTRLRSFQPIHAGRGEEGVFEHTDESHPTFRVATLDYLAKVVALPETRTVVLTGDAGHGKTSLCASLLEQLGDSRSVARQKVLEHGGGTEPVAKVGEGRPLYVLKDLSASTPEAASARLVELLSPPDAGVAILCANEGQLRSAISIDTSNATKAILDTLARGIDQGAVRSPDGALYVINLNYQSVAPERESGGLVDWAVRTWASDRRSWQICKECDAQAICPIFANHAALSDPVRGTNRRNAVRDLFRTAERTGEVITTRQVLNVVSYAITGGLVCADVERRYSNSHRDSTWQAPYLYHQALFGDLLSGQKRQKLPTMSALRRLDPGHVSRRKVDDSLDPEIADVAFKPYVPGSDGQPRTTSRKEAQRDAVRLRSLMVFLRRTDYFDSPPTGRLARLGLTAGDAFVAIGGGRAATPTSVRDEVLKGLEAVQGIHRPGKAPEFLVLDPAFFSHRTRAAVISLRIKNRTVDVVDQVTQWDIEALEGATPELNEAVEWLNRTVFVRLPGPDGTTVSVALSMLRFELLKRWAAGLRSGNQHEAEIRGITGTLAGLTSASDDDEDIRVLVGGKLSTLMIDVGDLIRSGDA
ncbi:hypothetical protein [Promicromonospora sp. NPDC023805]|uniref:hypothetical protein n=1 Tax=Promicromonospora sp. NPDC023805 TaxID=3154696 RepID=UPI0033F70E25